MYALRGSNSAFDSPSVGKHIEVCRDISPDFGGQGSF